MKITLPAVGDQVRLIFTDEKGEVTRIIDRETVAVRIAGDIIPVFAEHLEVITPPKIVHLSQEKTSNNPKTAQKTPPPPKQFSKEEQAQRLKAAGLHAAPDNLPDRGLRVVMQPFYRTDGIIDYFLLHLLNDSGKPLQFTYRLFLDTHENEVFTLKQSLGGRESCILNDLQYDDMNENPELQFDIEVLSIHDEETYLIRKFERDLKPKPKILRNPPVEIGRINGRGYGLELCPHLPHKTNSTHTPPPSEVLFDKDLQKIAEKLEIYDKTIQQENSYQPKVAINAHLRTTDLHIEKLVTAYKHLSNSDIIQIQMSHFKKQLEEAIQRHEKSMIVIHGLGKGKLKQEVFKLLMQYSEVSNFSNEYDQRFGFGATLIEFHYD